MLIVILTSNSFIKALFNVGKIGSAVINEVGLSVMTVKTGRAEVGS